MNYFQNFPTIPYSFDTNPLSNYNIVTNIFSRVGFSDSLLTNIDVYYIYTMQENDTFEGIASRLYGDPNRYWIILFANLILDPQYQAPLPQQAFQNYINNKYGSIINAQSILEHYEKVKKNLVTFAYQPSTTTTSVTYYANTTYSILDDYSGTTISNLPTLTNPSLNLTSPPPLSFANSVITTTVTLNAVNAYDAEVSVNNAKRNIQLPKKEYISQIEASLITLLTQ